MTDASDLDKMGDSWVNQYKATLTVATGDEVKFTLNGERIYPGASAGNLSYDLETKALTVKEGGEDLDLYLKVYADGGYDTWFAAPEKPAEVDSVKFNLGDDVTENPAHADGTGATTYSETVSGYKLSITDGVKLYTGAKDATGNGCLKLGTGSATASFKIQVVEGVKKVILEVAGYKANKAVISINGGEGVEVTNKSDDGSYAELEATPVEGVVTVETTSDGKRAMINSITFVFKDAAPVEIAQPVGNYSAKVSSSMGDVFVVVAMADEVAYVSVGDEKHPDQAFTYDKATGLLTFALGGNYGNLTATYDPEADALVNVGVDGAAAAILTDNGNITLNAAAHFYDCEGTAEDLNAVFGKRVRNSGSWSTTLVDIALEETNVIAGASAVARAGSTTDEAIGLTLRHDLDEAEALTNIGFWVYNSSDKDVLLRTWVFTGKSYGGANEIGNLTAKAGQWTYCRMGFKYTIYNFNVCDFNKTGIDLVFDNIALF